MKILVTGGAGFIGSHIADAYIQLGHQVLILDDLSTGVRSNVNPKAAFYQADICSKEAFHIIAEEKPEIINHHAAQIDIRKSVEDPLFDVQVNIGGIINILQACTKGSLSKFIFASSGGAIYGEQNEFPANERHATEPLSPYGINKLTGEKFIAYYAGILGFKKAFFRYANVYGPRQNPKGEAGVISIFADKMLAGQQPVINGDGLQTRDYVNVRDVVRANVLALKDGFEGIYNIGTGVETSVNELFHQLLKLIPGPYSETHGPAKAGEQARSCLSTGLLKDKWGWTPEVKLDQGLKETVAWFKERLAT